MKEWPKPDRIEKGPLSIVGTKPLFTGVAYSTRCETFGYYLDSQLHREFGPAWIEKSTPDRAEYFLNGEHYNDHKEYWKIMYKKYKGTEHEELCLSHLLGAK